VNLKLSKWKRKQQKITEVLRKAKKHLPSNKRKTTTIEKKVKWTTLIKTNNHNTVINPTTKQVIIHINLKEQDKNFIMKKTVSKPHNTQKSLSNI